MRKGKLRFYEAEEIHSDEYETDFITFYTGGILIICFVILFISMFLGLIVAASWFLFFGAKYIGLDKYKYHLREVRY